MRRERNNKKKLNKIIYKSKFRKKYGIIKFKRCWKKKKLKELKHNNKGMKSNHFIQIPSFSKFSQLKRIIYCKYFSTIANKNHFLL